MSKIFIVEDEGAIADLEKDYLELSGFEVEVENDGNMGLQKALEEDFDLLILDLMLPGVDGFEICRRVRDEKDVPIIMVLKSTIVLSRKRHSIRQCETFSIGTPSITVKCLRHIVFWNKLIRSVLLLWILSAAAI